MTRSILRWPGSKTRLGPWLVGLMPPARIYIEPYLGSAAVLLARPPATVEVVGDLDGGIVNLFRVARDPEQCAQLAEQISLTPWAREEWEEARDHDDPGLPPVERARRFLVRSHQGYGGLTGRSTGWRHTGTSRASVCGAWARLPEDLALVCARLKRTQIESRPALELLARYRTPDALLYLDPPYLGETRMENLYRVEMGGVEAHRELLAAALAHPGPVVISGYESPLYAEMLRGWSVARAPSLAQGGREREEVAWVNRPIQGRLL